jgi:hypothetical protein
VSPRVYMSREVATSIKLVYKWYTCFVYVPYSLYELLPPETGLVSRSWKEFVLITFVWDYFVTPSVVRICQR